MSAIDLIIFHLTEPQLCFHGSVGMHEHVWIKPFTNPFLPTEMGVL